MQILLAISISPPDYMHEMGWMELEKQKKQIFEPSPTPPIITAALKHRGESRRKCMEFIK
jgi:hypothetical protein